jgi:DNA-binding NarL/FixJ family response regulator
LAGENAPIRVLLADDHTMFRQGLAGMLAAYGGMEVVAEVPNDEDALRLTRELRPDVVVMQVQMPLARAIGTLEAMRSFPDPPKVVIVTMLESPRYVRAITGAGVSAYLAEATVKRHLANVYEKMGVGSRREAAKEALLRGWITIEEMRGSAPGGGQADRG